MPPNAIYCGRPTMWGNNWRIGGWSNQLGRNVATVRGKPSNSIAPSCGQTRHHRALVPCRNLAGHDLRLLVPPGCPLVTSIGLLEIANTPEAT